jgi:putative membrane protein
VRATRKPEDEGEDPDYRFSLANERTFLAWIRTSLGLLAGGVAIVQFVPEFSVPGGRLVLGFAFAALALLIAVTSYGRWARNERAMRLSRSLPRSPVPRVLAMSLSVLALVSIVLFVHGSLVAHGSASP